MVGSVVMLVVVLLYPSRFCMYGSRVRIVCGICREWKQQGNKYKYLDPTVRLCRRWLFPPRFPTGLSRSFLFRRQGTIALFASHEFDHMPTRCL